MAIDEDLAERVRSALAARGIQWEEQHLFGSLVFLVGEAIVLSARNGGGLLVRCDPAETESLLAQAGSWYARPARMGRHQMSDSWIDVAPDAVADEPGLEHWVAAALRR